MLYYEVLVGSTQYHGAEALTYSWEEEIKHGTIVQVALRQKKTLGIIYSVVEKPAFETKSISSVAPYDAVPQQVLQLIKWLRQYYPAHFGAIVRQFLPPSIPYPKTTVLKHSDKSKPDTKSLPALTKDQRKAYEQIESSGYHLLHGITGSGKTRIYIEKALHTVVAGRSAIILTPEIGLTTQLYDVFSSVFQQNVFVLHSRQTSAQRRDIWYQILSAKVPVVIIGPRSALFAPARNVGLIVIDESHDQAYKNETAPHYRTERVAAMLGSLHDACVISASATPNIDDYYFTKAKERPVINLDSLAKERPATEKTTKVIIDMRDASNHTKSKILSNALIEEMQSKLETSNQSLLFLNRRGTAAAILCNSCGWRALCSHCDLPLTYHGDAHSLRCHTCGRSSELPKSCPECGNTDIVLRSIGTKAIADEVRRLFPQASVQRFDSDSAKDEQLETQLASLQNGEVDIIIGTQMITKGLDLPNLSLVGILNADSSLLIPDFTSTERTYQLISQTIGRVGRGHSEGTVIVQTYSPEQTVLHAALESKWDEYYKQELGERKLFHFPPFVYLLKLTCSRASSDKAEETALAQKLAIASTHSAIAIEGPSPSFHPRENQKYKWQLIVKSRNRTALLEIIAELPSGWSYDIDPINLL